MKEIKMIPADEDTGDLTTMKDWLEQVKDNNLIDYDGFGCYSNGTSVVDDGSIVTPSMVKKGEIDMSWSHIMWYNR